MPVELLHYYDDQHKLPVGQHLDAVCSAAKLSKYELQLRLGVVDRSLLDLLSDRAGEIARLLPEPAKPTKRAKPPAVFKTNLGVLHQGDCLDLLARMDDESVDVVFADPPFNLRKLYPSGINDDLVERAYLEWCEQWLEQCVRVLRMGGSFFLWNLPRWNAALADFLMARLTFRHWIATDLKFSLPIGGRLYPSHYALLYFCKGERPRVFHPDRLPMEICHHCYGDLRDYGGYKAKMNPAGVNLTDIWYDIPPVRHATHKKRNGANELSIRLLDRVIEMSSDEGDLVFDPFGGGGTTYAVAEIKSRRWLGIEIGPVEPIIDRLKNIDGEAARIATFRSDYNHLFTPENRTERERRGMWTDRTVRLNGQELYEEEVQEQSELAL